MSAWTEDDLAKLEKAIASGASRVEYKDRRVEYRSMADMMKLRDTMKRELGLLIDSGRRYACFKSGT